MKTLPSDAASATPPHTPSLRGCADDVRRAARVIAIIVHHRGFELIETTVRSVRASRSAEPTIVIVLNGCEEGLPPEISEFPDVHIVTLDKPLGFAAANNHGAQWARDQLGEPDFLYFLNNDTDSSPEALARLVEHIESNPRLGIVGPRLMIAWAPNHINSLGLNVTRDAWGWDEGIGVSEEDYGEYPSSRSVLAVTGSALLIRYQSFTDIGGWTELYDYYFEDIDLCIKARSRGWEVAVNTDAVVYHHISATGGIDSDWKHLLFWRNRLLLGLAHWPLRLLLKEVLSRALIDELLGQPAVHTTMHQRALKSALGRVHRALWVRARFKARNREWVRMLRPAGSVPIISLPGESVASSDPETNTNAQTSDESTQSHLLDVATRWASFDNGGRVLVLGCAPLPFENARMNYAPGGRTWQMARGLADAGHRVVALCQRIPDAYVPGEAEAIDVESHDDILIIRTPDLDKFEEGFVARLVEACRPVCIVGATARPSLHAIRAAGGRPVMADLFGDPMAEAQARSVRIGEGDQLTAYRDLLAELMVSADAFSVVSERQKWASMGQLGMLGRLNRHTSDVEMVHTVPCSLPSWYTDEQLHPAIGGFAPSEGPSGGIGNPTFTLLWSGGFNTWCDAETLFYGVERVMAIRPEVRLVATGGAISGHDDTTHRTLVELVNNSPNRDRWHLLGCLPREEADAWVRRADLGVITEKDLPERLLGSSGRLVNWLAVGIPVLTTGLSEIGRTLVNRELVLSYEPGDAESLERAILSAVNDPATNLNRARAARKFAISAWNLRRSVEPVVRWVETASPAPDHGHTNPIADKGAFRQLAAMIATVEAAERKAETAERKAEAAERNFHQVRGELGTVHQSTMWRTWIVLTSLRRAVTWPIRYLKGHNGR